MICSRCKYEEEKEMLGFMITPETAVCVCTACMVKLADEALRSGVLSRRVLHNFVKGEPLRQGGRIIPNKE